MAIINKEKVTFAIQSFLMYLNISKDSQNLKQEQVESFKEKTINLLEKLSTDQADPLSSALELNTLIETMNGFLKAPYPTLMTDTSENLVKGEIVAFEHYLNQELKANHLTVSEEAPLFNASLKLWENVGVSLSAKEGVSQFSAIVEKLNSLLPEDERYPLPEEEQY